MTLIFNFITINTNFISDDNNTYNYCRANQKWQWRNILFTIVK